MTRKSFRYPPPTFTSLTEATLARTQLQHKWPIGTRVQVNGLGRLLNVREHKGKIVQYTGFVKGYLRNPMIDGYLLVTFDGLRYAQSFPVQYLEKI